MSINYGEAGYAPPGRVNFGWIGEAWQYFGQAAGVWLLAVLLYGIVTNIGDGLISVVFHDPAYVAPPGPFGGSRFDFGVRYGTNSNVTALGQIIGALFTWVYGAFQNASLYHLAVKQVRGEPITFGDAFGGGPYFLNMLLLNLLLFIFIFAGTLALCLGLFVVAGLFLPTQALVADGRSALDAISLSFENMKRDWLNAALFVLVYLLLIIASCLPCFLGLFVTIPMLHLIGAMAYRDMIGMPNRMQPQTMTPLQDTPSVWPPPPGAVPPPPSFSQTPSFGQPPINPSIPPPAPPRQSLSGEPLDESDSNAPSSQPPLAI